MKLFAYYSIHSCINQLRKIFKTWVLVLILVCALIGGLIGFGASMLSDAAPEDPAAAQEIEEIIDQQEPMSFEETFGIGGMEAMELAAGGVILVMLGFMVFSAENSAAKIFLPADVNLLFASPMKPQSVLMFRLATQLGAAMAASLYLLFQIPNLVINLGVSVWAALSVIAAWYLLMLTGKLIQMSVYVLTSVNPFIKKHLHKILFAFLALLTGAFYLYYRSQSAGWLPAAAAFFNAPWTRWIPFWGWLKGFVVCALQESPMAFVYLGVLAAGCGILAYFIWNIETDFYEEAMTRSQEVAEIMEAAASERGGLLIQRKKNRSEKLERDGFHYGSGANVYFYKTLYNRFRFGHLKYFTKTTETYLAASVLAACAMRFIADTKSVMPLVFLISGLVFFRTLGNPLNEDVRLDYFRLIPEKTWKKLFWSLLGGSVNCLLDVIPGLIIGSLIMGVNPLQALAWIPLIISVDFYATNVGTFLDVSIPTSIGLTIKQTIEVLFVYFGLVPDVIIITVGSTFHHPVIASVICAIVNLYLGLLFMGLATVFTDPYGGRDIERDGTEVLDPQAKTTYSWLGIVCAFILIAGSLLQVGIVRLFANQTASLTADQWPLWLITFLPLYLFAVPLGLLFMKKLPAVKIPEKKLPAKYWLILPVIAVFLMYAGNLIGSLITLILSTLFKASADNPLISLSGEGTLVQRLVFMVILAPVIEEYIFRKQLIDRMHVYGGRTAVIASGLMFGLFHGNFSQFYYADALGIVFGYVYLKTGRLRYTVALHMGINFLGGIIGPEILQNFAYVLNNLEHLLLLSFRKLLTFPQVYSFIIYIVLLLALFLAGFVLLVQQSREVSFPKEEKQIPRGKIWKNTYAAPGMLCFTAACIFLFIYSIL